ncbi:DUF4124 domain-containing protein, partial [Oceanospirillum linum]
SLSFSLSAAPLYHWLDEQGYPVYSDLPQGASRIQQHQSHSLPQAQPHTQVQLAEGYTYQSLRLKSYQTEQPNQRIIRVHITPTLHKTHRIALYLDEKPYQSAIHSVNFLLHQLPKGRHKLTAQVQDRQGRVLLTSKAIDLITLH